MNEIDCKNLENLTKKLLSSQETLVILYKSLNCVDNIVVITDVDGKIIWVNRAFVDFTGYSLEEAIGNKPNILKSGKHDEQFYRNMWITILSGKTWSGEIYNKYKDGSIHHEYVKIHPVIENEKIRYFIAIKQVKD